VRAGDVVPASVKRCPPGLLGLLSMQGQKFTTHRFAVHASVQ
jgi:hypothetical protein